MEKYSLISVVILNYNGKGIVEPCLASVLNSNYPNFEVVLVDNASCDGSIEIIEKTFGNNDKLKIVKNNKNLFYAEGNNIGIDNARGEYIFILNNDTEIDKNCLKEIAEAMKDESIGAGQPKILVYGQSSIIDNTGGIIDRYGYTKGRGSQELDVGQYDNLRQIFYAGGTAMVLKRNVLNEIGIFDPEFVAHWEDVDLSWRIRLRGYKIIFIPQACLYHKISKTIKRFGNYHRISFYIRKNRIAGLIKNYAFCNLIKTLPILILIYFLMFIKELNVDKDVKLALSSIWAIIWNIKELPYILRARWRVQRKIRRISDSQILNFMQSGFIVFQAMCLYMGKKCNA